MRILGIDPGCTGAIALLIDGRLDSVHDMPFFLEKRGKTNKKFVEGYALGDLMKSLRPDVAYLERVWAQPNTGSPAAFSFGQAYGAATQALKSEKIVVELVMPQRWKKDMRLIGTDKHASIGAAMKMWPDKYEYFKRKMDHGRAEAALIAEWGRKFHQQTTESPDYDIF